MKNSNSYIYLVKMHPVYSVVSTVFSVAHYKFLLILFPHQFGQGLLGAGAKTAIISDSDDDMDRVNRIAIDKGAGRRLDALNSRPVSCFSLFDIPICKLPEKSSLFLFSCFC